MNCLTEGRNIPPHNSRIFRKPFQSGRNSVEQQIYNQNTMKFKCSTELESLLKGLLREKEEERFGYAEISQHAFFKGNSKTNSG